jgi:hypothetical protein
MQRVERVLPRVVRQLGPGFLTAHNVQSATATERGRDKVK